MNVLHSISGQWFIFLILMVAQVPCAKIICCEQLNTAAFLLTPDKKHRKLRFLVLFCYKNAANVVGQGAGQTLTHTLTHMPKCAERVKEHRRGSYFLSDALVCKDGFTLPEP